MVISENSDRRLEITRITWDYLSKTGLEKASIGDLCRHTGLSQSSLYHFFENKDDIWISAGKYGLSKVVDVLFGFTMEHTTNVSGFFAGFLNEVDIYKEDLRLAVQITSIPTYGPRMRETSRSLIGVYEQYAGKLMQIFNCTTLQANVFIYTILSIVIDYIVWDDREIAQMLLDNLRNRTLNLLKELQSK